MSRKARKNVGVIGLGIIGMRVAAGLRAAGYQAYVWNRSAKPAPNFLGSPAEVADSTDIIQIFVADAAALFEVIESMADALTTRHVVVCNSTVGPEAVMDAARTVQVRGAQFLDAPFTGSKLAAEKQQLVYYVGGSEAAFLRVRPILEITSKAIVRMGEIGHASTIKVVTNMISAVTIQALAEALCIVQKAGLEPELLAAAIEQNACRSGVIDLKLPKMIAGDYEPHFSLKHMFKDVQLGIHMANALDIEIPTTTVTAGVMYGAINQGWGDLDFSSLYRNYAAGAQADQFPALLPAEAGAEQAFAPAGAERFISETEFAGEPGREMPDEVSLPPNSSVPPAALAAVENEVEDAKDQLPAAKADKSPEDFEASDTGAGSNRPEISPTIDVADEESAERELAAVKSELLPEQDGESENASGTSDAAEPSSRPNNFVRRWFVARTSV